MNGGAGGAGGMGPVPKGRRVVQVSTMFDAARGTGNMIVLCDDGTLWERVRRDNAYLWKPVETPPLFGDGS